jgi:hypothetical protein
VLDARVVHAARAGPSGPIETIIAIVADRANQLGHTKPLIGIFDTTDSFGQLAKMLATHVTLTFALTGIIGTTGTIGPHQTLGEITDKFVTTRRHPMPGKDGLTDTMVKFVTNVNGLATLITRKIERIRPIQTKVISLQSGIKRINRVTLCTVITGTTGPVRAACATTGKFLTNGMIRFDPRNRCHRHNPFNLAIR